MPLRANPSASSTPAKPRLRRLSPQKLFSQSASFDNLGRWWPALADHDYDRDFELHGKVVDQAKYTVVLPDQNEATGIEYQRAADNLPQIEIGQGLTSCWITERMVPAAFSAAAESMPALAAMASIT